MTTAADYIKNFVGLTEAQIIALIDSELNNEEKKAKLDNVVTTWANTALDKLSLNIFTKWVIRKYLIGNIETLTQMVYNLLKTRVANLTKKEV
jgi:hypothetical protein